MSFKQRFFRYIEEYALTRGQYGVSISGGHNTPQDPDCVFSWDPDFGDQYEGTIESCLEGPWIETQFPKLDKDAVHDILVAVESIISSPFLVASNTLPTIEHDEDPNFIVRAGTYSPEKSVLQGELRYGDEEISFSTSSPKLLLSLFEYHLEKTAWLGPEDPPRLFPPLPLWERRDIFEKVRGAIISREEIRVFSERYPDLRFLVVPFEDGITQVRITRCVDEICFTSTQPHVLLQAARKQLEEMMW